MSGGYASPGFAEACRHIGAPRRLAASAGSVLIRPIGATGLSDAMGCYPLFCCGNWSGLAADLEGLTTDTVSLVLVSDPFGPLDEAGLRRLFDHVALFKLHHIADLAQPTRAIVPAKHHRAATGTLRRIEVEVHEGAAHLVDDWLALQDELARRRPLGALHRLPRQAAAQLFGLPGTVIVRARIDDRTLGMHIDMVDGGNVYAHLAAYSAEGYRMNVSNALNVFEIDYFRGRAQRIDWGGGQGAGDDGLASFKDRFSTHRLPVYLCGRIFNRAAYDRLSATRDTPWFPAYRAGEAA